MRANLKPLNEAIKDFGTKALDEGQIVPAEFAEEFKEAYPELVEEFKDYGFTVFLKDKARNVLKKMSLDLRKAYGGEISTNIDDTQIPQMLPIKRNIGDEVASFWIKRQKARRQDIKNFSANLKKNIDACIFRMVDWLEYEKIIDPVLEKHPEWTVGEAEAYLRQQGIDLAPILGEREPEEVV